MSLTLTIPYKHQDYVIDLSKDRDFFALFMEQGTGKSLVIIATIVHLFRTGKINGVLVLSPNGIQDVWVQNEIPKHIPLRLNEDYVVAAWHGADGQRKRNKWLWTSEQAPPDCLAILCANVEAMRTESFRKTIASFLNNRKVMLVVDESSVIKNHKAAQTKEIFKVAQHVRFRRIMTGTPITQSPLDLFAQCRILSTDALPYTSWTAFKHEFANEIQQRFGHKSFAQIIGYKNEDKLAQIVSKFSYRILKKDCLDLPDKVYKVRPIEMTAEQKKVYRDLVTTAMAQLAPTDIVTAPVVITLLLRLHQVLLGYVSTDDGKIVEIEHNRTQALLDIATTSTGKIIIFCRFLYDVKQVCQYLDAYYGPQSQVVRYTGEESAGERHHATDKFQNDPAIRFFVATSAAARGLTLTAAEQVIYYSQDYKLETRLQSEDRAHRSGQTKTVVYTDMFCPGTVEEQIIKALKDKKQLADTVMDAAALLNLVQLENGDA